MSILPIAAADTHSAEIWPAWRLGLFRFTFCYLLLYTIPSNRRFWFFDPVGAAYGTQWLASASIWVWDKVDAFATVHLFGPDPTGNRLPWIDVYCLLGISALACAVWSRLDRKRTEYWTLYAWFRVWMRYCLALVLFSYGFDKVFVMQMPFYPVNLVTRWGDMSPFTVFWGFMSASNPYQMMCGWMEVVPAVLLLFRRTTTLGAAISLTVMVNVTALDFCFDVEGPRVFALHLALISLYLLAGEWPRLSGTFFLNRAAPKADLSRPVISRRWVRVALRVVAIYVVACALYTWSWGPWKSYKSYYIDAPEPLRGLYEVKAFLRNGTNAPALATDADRWGWVWIPGTNHVTTVAFTGDMTKYKTTVGTNWIGMAAGPISNYFTYSQAGVSNLTLRGKVGKDALEVRLQKMDLKSFNIFQHQGD